MKKAKNNKLFFMLILLGLFMRIAKYNLFIKK